MAQSIIQPTLFGRLRQLLRTVRAARVEVETLRDSMDTGGEPAKDLHMQLGNALDALDMALDEMAPRRRFHIDQPVRARAVEEVAHG
jgi:hypothetical protein